MRLQDKVEYRISEIVKNAWILNSKRKPDYFYILYLVKNGLLKARDYREDRPKKRGVQYRPYWLILGKDIRLFNAKNKLR